MKFQKCVIWMRIFYSFYFCFVSLFSAKRRKLLNKRGRDVSRSKFCEEQSGHTHFQRNYEYFMINANFKLIWKKDWDKGWKMLPSEVWKKGMEPMNYQKEGDKCYELSKGGRQVLWINKRKETRMVCWMVGNPNAAFKISLRIPDHSIFIIIFSWWFHLEIFSLLVKNFGAFHRCFPLWCFPWNERE